jgi:uncharacterized protein YecE (DUF72 family)
MGAGSISTVSAAMVRDPRIGCCGFPLARARYFSRFPVVEVQQTFYHPPRLQTLERWRREAPGEFEFALKAWQLITHQASSPTYRRLRKPVPESRGDRYGSFQPTDEVMAAWRTTLQAARVLRARVVVFQCPASFSASRQHIDNLRRFFTMVRVQAPDLLPCWEPRGEWPSETVGSLCRELGLVHVVDPFHSAPCTSGVRYFRLHGRTGYRYRYTDEDLRCLLNWCVEPCYCLFNNITMLDDGARFLALVERAGDSGV